MSYTSDVLARLRDPFPPEQVKVNQDGLDYVSIDGYIGRLLDVLGMSYDFTVTQSSVQLLDESMKTSTGKRLYLAQVTGELSIHAPGAAGTPTSRSGTGADVAFDADKAVKTAQAEALKKACHQFGIALELWDADYRDGLEARRKILKTEKSMKIEVFRIAKEKLGKATPTAAEVAGVFDKQPGDLADKAVLREILEAEGVL